MSTDSSSANTGFLFPGQGAQTVGMGVAVYHDVPAAGWLFDRASQALGYDLYKLCAEGPAEELDKTDRAQPAIFVASLAAMEKLRQDNPKAIENCRAAAGLSLGEYTALVFAGAMDFEHGLKVVQARGEAMQAAAEVEHGGMVSVLGLDQDKVEELCKRARGDWRLEIANLLCPGNIVVSGTTVACERFVDLANAAGAMKVIPLAVAGAFHTPMMESAVDRLREALKNSRLHKPRMPVVSNVDARPHIDPEEIRGLLVKQVCSPVLWEDSMWYMMRMMYIDQFYECGPGRVLTGLLKRIDRKVQCENIPA
jgi:[acyl-carrier-protein] S-malonyltransferase